MKTFKQFVSTLKNFVASRNQTGHYDYWKALDKDQKMNPEDRIELQKEVHAAYRKNPDAAFRDSRNAHGAFILHQHMDSMPHAQSRFLDHMTRQISLAKKSGHKGKVDFLTKRAEFLRDRLAVNREVRRLVKTNPDKYRDASGNPLPKTDEVGQLLRSSKNVSSENSTAPKKTINTEFKTADEAYKAMEPGLLHDAITNLRKKGIGKTQPSFTNTWKYEHFDAYDRDNSKR